MREKKITINDVAERAGVSKSVVSIVLSGRNGTVRVSEETRKKVLDAVKETHYQPSLMARSLFEKKSFLIAHLCTGGSGWSVSTRMLRSIQKACYERNYSMILYPSDSLEEERSNLQAAVDRQVDGIITSPLMLYDKTNQAFYRKVASDGMNIVQIGKILSGITSVSRDYPQITEDGIRRLYDLGCRKIGFLTYDNYNDPASGPSSNEEFQSYESMMKTLGLSSMIFPISISGNPSDKQNYKVHVMKQSWKQILPVLKKKSRPEALLASSNSLAYGACLAARELGLEIPHDLSIISCSDDFVVPDLFLPKLSCFPMDAKEIGRRAVELCLNSSAIQNIRIIQSFEKGESEKQI